MIWLKVGKYIGQFKNIFMVWKLWVELITEYHILKGYFEVEVGDWFQLDLVGKRRHPLKLFSHTIKQPAGG